MQVPFLFQNASFMARSSSTCLVAPLGLVLYPDERSAPSAEVMLTRMHSGSPFGK